MESLKEWDWKKWIISVLLILTIGIGGYAWSSLAGDVTRLEGSERDHIAKDAKVYEQVAAMKEAIDRIDRQTDRLDERLEKLKELILKTH